MKKYNITKTVLIIAVIMILTVGISTIAYAEEKTASWASNDKGWWIQYSDGTYLTDSWYQSLDSGLWYYMGADGYMLVNTTTPDGYIVNADGVRQESNGGGSSNSGNQGSNSGSSDNSNSGSSGTKPLPPIAPAQGGDITEGRDGFGQGW